jgi:hypothetical protein
VDEPGVGVFGKVAVVPEDSFPEQRDFDLFQAVIRSSRERNPARIRTWSAAIRRRMFFRFPATGLPRLTGCL